MPDTITYSRLRNELAKSLEETAYLVRSPRNAARLRAAREEIEKEIARRAATRRPRRARRR